MRYRRSIAPRVEFVRERVKGDRVLAEIRYVKDSLGVGQVEVGEIGVQARVWRAEVWNASRGGDAGACLWQSEREDQRKVYLLILSLESGFRTVFFF